MRLKLVEVKTEPGDVKSFMFQPEKPFRWQPGQFLQFFLEHDNPDDRGTERYFTIASAPHEEIVMLTTRIPGKHSTFKEALLKMPLGSEVEAGEPEGDFVVGEVESEYVFIAGGIGITPFRSILVDKDRQNMPILAKVLYANRDDKLVFRSTLESIVSKHPSGSIHYYIGEDQINEDAIRHEVPDLSKPQFFVSGPEPMVQKFEKMLLGMGLPEEQVKRDYFPGYDWP